MALQLYQHNLERMILTYKIGEAIVERARKNNSYDKTWLIIKMLKLHELNIKLDDLEEKLNELKTHAIKTGMYKEKIPELI